MTHGYAERFCLVAEHTTCNLYEMARGAGRVPEPQNETPVGAATSSVTLGLSHDDLMGGAGPHGEAPVGGPSFPPDGEERRLAIDEPLDGSTVTGTVIDLSGSAPPRARLYVVDWTVVRDVTRADDQGLWSTRVYHVDPGDHLFRIQHVDSEGAILAESPGVSFSTVAPAGGSPAPRLGRAVALARAEREAAGERPPPRSSRRAAGALLGIAAIAVVLAFLVLRRHGGSTVHQTAAPRAPTASVRRVHGSLPGNAGASGSAAVHTTPARTYRWVFAAVKPPVDQALLTFYNPTARRVVARVQIGGVQTRTLRIAPRSSAEFALDGRRAAERIAATAPVPLHPQRALFAGGVASAQQATPVGASSPR